MALQEVSSDALFGSWLKETLDLQIDYYGRPAPGILYGEELAQCVMLNTTAMVAEWGEMLAEFPGWKPWAIGHDINRDALVGEMVDALHFVANILTAVGCTDEELNDRYSTKMLTNRRRMASGTYDGVGDKCTVCHRELVLGVCPDLSHRTGESA